MSDTPQIRLEPDRPEDAADYANARWRWLYNETVSAWFTSRDAALADAAAQHPGIGIG